MKRGVKPRIQSTLEHIALPARNINALRDWYVAKLDATCIAPNGADRGRVLFFKDCEGNLLHLVDRPKDSVFA